MTWLLDALDTKVVGRWLRALLPALIFLVVLCVSVLLWGHEALDIAPFADLSKRIDKVATINVIPLILLSAVALIGSTAIALLCQGTSTLVHRGFIATRPRKWIDRLKRRARQSKGPQTTPRYAPARLTTIGDRFHWIAERSDAQYGVNATLAWPRLWLLLPDHAIIRIQTSFRLYKASTETCSWGLLYLAVGIAWWPSAIVGATLLVVGYFRAKAAAGVLAELIEAAIDIKLNELAHLVGVVLPHNRITPAEGAIINNVLSKGT